MNKIRKHPVSGWHSAVFASSRCRFRGHAGGVSVGINVGIPAPVYIAPQPYYAPPPPPVIYQSAPVYVHPPIVIGWYGNRYYDGRRYWGRDDWYRRHGGHSSRPRSAVMTATARPRQRQWPWTSGHGNHYH